MKNKILITCSLLALTGCVSKYATDAYHAPLASLKRSAGFYVMQPANGSYGSIQYAESGKQTAQAVAEALESYTDRVVAASSVQSLSTARRKAQSQSLKYVFEPTILHWEDRATEWSGIPDKITVKYAVYDSKTGKLIASETERASSKWATFGGDHPQDLLPVPTKDFVARLF